MLPPYKIREIVTSGRVHILVAESEFGALAELVWSATTGEVVGVTVWNKAHKCQGLATALWCAACATDYPPRHSAERTPEGDAWARKVGGYLPPLATKLGGLGWD